MRMLLTTLISVVVAVAVAAHADVIGEACVIDGDAVDMAGDVFAVSPGRHEDSAGEPSPVLESLPYRGD
jgi:hypothetical protein